MSPSPDRSYRALLAVPSLGRMLLGMQVARIGQAMVSVAMVLFTLAEFHSAALAGLVTFVGIFPGLIAAPIAGALLDRHGRTRLVVLDEVVAACSMLLIGGLAAAGLLTPPLLVLIAGLSSLTGPLSNTGLRSLFPLLVPRHLWERANAFDSNGYVLATVVGPPVAGLVVQLVGGPVALAGIGVVFAIAAVVLLGTPDPPTATVSSGRLLLDAWRGLLYTWRNPTLRALGFSISAVNLSGGMVAIVVPLIVLNRLHLGPAAVGGMFAVMGVFGVLAAFLFGRLDSDGRERRMLTWSMLGCAAATLLLLPDAGPLPLVASLGLVGLLNGPMDIALFTLRQRRTDPAWMGRAFAVSMAFNYLGNPVGSAVAGWLAGVSVPAAVAFGAGGCLAGAAIARWAIPDAHGPAPGAARQWSERTAARGATGAPDPRSSPAVEAEISDG